MDLMLVEVLVGVQKIFYKLKFIFFVPVDGQFGRRPASNDNPGTNWYS
jgi:hypothetical protein